MLSAAIQKLHREGKLAVDHFTIHDFCRTCRSLLSAEEVPGHVAERCLNHKLKGVEGIYAAMTILMSGEKPYS